MVVNTQKPTQASKLSIPILKFECPNLNIIIFSKFFVRTQTDLFGKKDLQFQQGCYIRRLNGFPGKIGPIKSLFDEFLSRYPFKTSTRDVFLLRYSNFFLSGKT